MRAATQTVAVQDSIVQYSTDTQYSTRANKTDRERSQTVLAESHGSTTDVHTHVNISLIHAAYLYKYGIAVRKR